MTVLQKTNSTFIENLLLRLVGKWRWPSLLAILALTAVMGFFALKVQIESSNSSMVSRDRELQVNYELFRKTFGNDEMLLLAVTRPDLLRPAGLQSLGRITAEIEALNGVNKVMSLTNAKQLVPGTLGAEAVPLVAQPYGGENQQKIAETLDRNPEMSQLLLSKDRRTGMVLIDLAGDAAQQGKSIAAIEALLASRFADQDLHLTGIPLLKLTVSQFIQRDQQVVIPLSMLVLSLLLLFMFRRLSGLLLPLAAMGISLCWTIGLYSLCGYQLNTITGLLPPVIMVISIATTVHLYSGWLHLAGQPGKPETLLAGEIGELFMPCLFTAITTALGLLSLLVSDVPAVQLFGVFCAIGVMITFVVNIFLVTSVLSFLPIPEEAPRIHQSGALRKVLTRTGHLTVNSPRLVLISVLLSAVAALSWLGGIRNNTDLVRFLKSSATLHRDTMFIDEAAGGVNRVEFMLSRKDGKPLTALEDMTRLESLQGAVDRLQNVSGSFSPVNLLKLLNRAETRQQRLVLPENGDDLLNLFDLLEAAPDQEVVRQILSTDFTRARLSVRTKAIGTSDTAELVAAVEAASANLLGGGYRLVPTGEYYQVVSDSNRLVANLVSSFSLSLVTVFLAIFLLFRSFKLLALALVPNLIPLAWTAGLIGFLRIDLSTGTAMIASVAIGLTVDSTIHYLARFQRENSGDCRDAVMRTTLATGRAMTISALVLFFGFSVGGFSSFLPTIYFSVLTGVTMLGALACDLLVLPASLVLYDAWQRR